MLDTRVNSLIISICRFVDGKRCNFLRPTFSAVMMAAVIDLAADEQKQVVRRLFRESGNVNVKTPHVSIN